MNKVASQELPGALKLLKKTPNQRAETLDHNRWLSRMDWHSVETFARYVDFYEVQRTHFVFREKDVNPFLCLVVTGEIQIVKGSPTGPQKAIATVGQGYTFGEMALIDGKERSASAIVSRDAVLCVLTEDNFQAVRQNHPHLWGTLLIRFVKTVTQRLRFASGKLVDLLVEGGENPPEPAAAGHVLPVEEEAAPIDGASVMRELTELKAAIKSMSPKKKVSSSGMGMNIPKELLELIDATAQDQGKTTEQVIIESLKRQFHM